MDVIEEITNAARPFSRSEVLASPSPVPKAAGIYAWYFSEIPGAIPTAGCVVRDGLTLLYVGISPKNARSTQNLSSRIRYHYRGNAEGSTLRLTLGVLLTEKSGFPLRRVGTGRRMTFTHLGEQWLDQWMDENAFVCWLKRQSPWDVEAGILRQLDLPLNIQDNQHHPYSRELSLKRRLAKEQARAEPIAREDNQQRRM